MKHMRLSSFEYTYLFYGKRSEMIRAKSILNFWAFKVLKSVNGFLLQSEVTYIIILNIAFLTTYCKRNLITWIPVPLGAGVTWILCTYAKIQFLKYATDKFPRFGAI